MESSFLGVYKYSVRDSRNGKNARRGTDYNTSLTLINNQNYEYFEAHYASWLFLPLRLQSRHREVPPN